MEYAGAVTTAASIAGKLDIPAYVYSTAKEGYQVACMGWDELDEAAQCNVVLLVTPDGREWLPLSKESCVWPS